MSACSTIGWSSGILLTALAVTSIITSPGRAQQPAGAPGASGAPAPPPNPATLAAQADRQNMMDSSISPRFAAAPMATTSNLPYYANYDESKANPYPALPDPLVMNNGKKVTTAAMWPARRAEIKEMFDREIYGRVPAVTPKSTWQVIKTVNEKNGEVPVITKTIVGHVDNSAYPAITVDIQLSLSTPGQCNRPRARHDVSRRQRTRLSRASLRLWRRRWRIRTGAFGGSGGGRGRGPAGPSLAAAGSGEGLGLRRPSAPAAFIGRQRRRPNRGHHRPGQQGPAAQARRLGRTRAWAWGCCRALDYFETDPAVDAKMVGLEGHSAGAKARLVAMAYDPRFAIAYVSSSGEGGAKLNRRNWGELVENVAGHQRVSLDGRQFPEVCRAAQLERHARRFARTYRHVRTASRLHQRRSHRGRWLGRRERYVHGRRGAQPVYKLLGKKDMGTNEFPAHRNRAHRWRYRLPPAQRRTHRCAELANVYHLRQPLPEVNTWPVRQMPAPSERYRNPPPLFGPISFTVANPARQPTHI